MLPAQHWRLEEGQPPEKLSGPREAGYLIIGWGRSRPLHVLVAVEAESQRCLVATAYVPDPALWREDFKTRRTP